MLFDEKYTYTGSIFDMMHCVCNVNSQVILYETSSYMYANACSSGTQASESQVRCNKDSATVFVAQFVTLVLRDEGVRSRYRTEAFAYYLIERRLLHGLVCQQKQVTAEDSHVEAWNTLRRIRIALESRN